MGNKISTKGKEINYLSTTQKEINYLYYKGERVESLQSQVEK